MTGIRLQAVNRDNWEECISLEVSEVQSGFVASNQYSLAEAFSKSEMRPFAIYNGNQMVGFLMYSLDREDKTPWIHRLMIAADYQRKGYGRLALRLAVQQITEEFNPVVISLSFEPENLIARALYESEGFTVTDEMVWGEVIARLYMK